MDNGNENNELPADQKIYKSNINGYDEFSTQETKNFTVCLLRRHIYVVKTSRCTKNRKFCVLSTQYNCHNCFLK